MDCNCIHTMFMPFCSHFQWSFLSKIVYYLGSLITNPQLHREMGTNTKFHADNSPSGSGWDPRELTWKGRKGLLSKVGTSSLSSDDMVTSCSETGGRN